MWNVTQNKSVPRSYFECKNVQLTSVTEAKSNMHGCFRLHALMCFLELRAGFTRKPLLRFPKLLPILRFQNSTVFNPSPCLISLLENKQKHTREDPFLISVKNSSACRVCNPPYLEKIRSSSFSLTFMSDSLSGGNMSLLISQNKVSTSRTCFFAGTV